MSWLAHGIPVGLAALLVSAAAGAGEGRLWFAGPYSFSDELGGFSIRGISGTGSRADPIVIDQEMFSASPVTLVVRATVPVQAFGSSNLVGMLHMRLRSLNSSGIPWEEYEFELQERLGIPSAHGDGLSFDQLRENPETRSSDLFKVHNTDFEPFDRLLFSGGHVDPRETAGFSFFITDFTPTAEFYIRQDPRIPLS